MPPSPPPPPDIQYVSGIGDMPQYYDGPKPFIVTYEDHGNYYRAEEYTNLTYRYVEFATAEEAQQWITNDAATSIYGNRELIVVDRRTGRIPSKPERSKEGKAMIDLNLKREGGRLFLYVNAKGLHETLDRIGATHSNGMYNDRPRASVTICDRGTHTLSTETLLKREYPAKYDLSGVYTDPVNVTNFKKLLDSAHEQTRKILEHYQPIDIKVSIAKKVVIPPGTGSAG